MIYRLVIKSSHFHYVPILRYTAPLCTVVYICIKYYAGNNLEHIVLSLTDYGRPMKPFFLSKSQIFGLGQTNWADKLWGIWGIFCKFISTHFGTVSPLSMFFINQPLFLQKTKPLHPHPKYLFGIWIWAAKN